MTSNIVITTGLILNLIGIILLFNFGFPQPNFSEHVGLVLGENDDVDDGMTGKQYAEKQREKKELYIFVSKISLVAIVVGSILQITGLWIC